MNYNTVELSTEPYIPELDIVKDLTINIGDKIALPELSLCTVLKVSTNDVELLIEKTNEKIIVDKSLVLKAME